jgi:hypothetical protein
MNTPDRHIIKIAITPGAKDSVDRTCERYGMTQIELASRVYDWFAQQDEGVQAAILGILPSSLAPDIARMVMKQVSSSPTAKAAKKPKRTVHVRRKAPPKA